VSSNFEGNTDYGRNNNISKTGTLSFTEDYTPRFEVIEETITLAIQNDGTANSKDQGYDLTPSFLNIVASSHAAWTINITGNGFSQSPDNGVQYSPIVSFTEPTNSNENTFEGTLTLTCKYGNIDPEGTTRDGIVTNETRVIKTKIIHLKATNDPTIKFGTGTENNLNATISTISGEGSNTTYRFTTNIDNINEQWNVETLLGGHNPTASHNITYSPQELSPEVTEVQVIIPSTILPGTYKTQLVASGTGTKITTNENNENIETTVTESATLTVTATVELATPEISAILGSACKVGISWEPIYGATEYYISSTEPKINQEGTLSFTQIAKLEPTVTEKDLGTLAENSTYTYYVIAACYKGATLVDAKWNSISITPANYPDRITLQGSDNSVAANNTGLETGTKSEGSFPNRAMRPIDVTSAFASDGTALMNRLYILVSLMKN
jgi:hypothetical protein